MNLLSIAAALGVVQAIFERGWLAGLVGVQPGPIDAFIPVMVFAIVFGLSMDYEVFLVSRIHEEWQHRGDASAAVREGLANTGRVITAAAAVMVAVFASFAAGDDRVLKLFGVSMATAVFLDAIVIRSILMPAVLELFGRRTWAFPSWFDRRLPRLAIEPVAAAGSRRWTRPPDAALPSGPVITCAGVVAARRRTVLAMAALTFALVSAGTASAYSWPVKPFHKPHPIRGTFGDPRYPPRCRGLAVRVSLRRRHRRPRRHTRLLGRARRRRSPPSRLGHDRPGLGPSLRVLARATGRQERDVRSPAPVDRACHQGLGARAFRGERARQLSQSAPQRRAHSVLRSHRADDRLGADPRAERCAGQRSAHRRPDRHHRERLRHATARAAVAVESSRASSPPRSRGSSSTANGTVVESSLAVHFDLTLAAQQPLQLDLRAGHVPEQAAPPRQLRLLARARARHDESARRHVHARGDGLRHAQQRRHRDARAHLGERTVG